MEEIHPQLHTTEPPAYMKEDFRSSPPDSQTAPWVVFFHKIQENNLQTFSSLSTKRYYIRNISQLERNQIWPTPQGGIFILNPDSKHCYLFNPVTLQEINLPNLKYSIPSHSMFVISTSPADPNCTILCNDNQDSFLFCRPRDKRWTQYNHNLGEHDFLYYITSYDAKFFGLTRFNFVAIYCYPNPGINTLEKINVKSPAGMCVHVEYLVESCGELYLVRTHQGSVRSEEVSCITVSKRDSYKKVWDDVDNIGGHVFFLDAAEGFSSSRSASELGLEEDCIYLLVGDDLCLYCFDMRKGTIRVNLPCPNVCDGSWSRSIWILPPV